MAKKKGKNGTGAPSPEQESGAPERHRLRAPEGMRSVGGPSGNAYQVGKDGTAEVLAEDVPALINLGFTTAD